MKWTWAHIRNESNKQCHSIYGSFPIYFHNLENTSLGPRTLHDDNVFCPQVLHFVVQLLWCLLSVVLLQLSRNRHFHYWWPKILGYIVTGFCSFHRRSFTSDLAAVICLLMSISMWSKHEHLIVNKRSSNLILYFFAILPWEWK